MFGAVETLASRFDPDQPHRLILDKVGERAHRVGATAYAGDNGVGQPSFFLQYLRPRLLADHALELPHHMRKGMRPGDGAEQVLGIREAGRPVAQGLVDRVIEASTAADRKSTRLNSST